MYDTHFFLAQVRSKVGGAHHTQEQNVTPFSWWCFAIQRELNS